MNQARDEGGRSHWAEFVRSSLARRSGRSLDSDDWRTTDRLGRDSANGYSKHPADCRRFPSGPGILVV